jgi:hypothetical protein
MLVYRDPFDDPFDFKKRRATGISRLPGNNLTATDFLRNSAGKLNFGVALFPSNAIYVHPTGPTPFDSWMGCC